MNREVVDRLLVDRALGALDPDTCELLTAYLDHDSDAAQRAQEFALATDWATRALGPAREAPMPPFPAALLAEAERSRRRMRIITRAASLAACLLLGIAVGAWAVRPGSDGPNSTIRARSASADSGMELAPVTRVAADGSAGVHGSQGADLAPARPSAANAPSFVQATPKTEHGFWSLQRYYEQVQKGAPSRPSQVEWISPVREPRVGGAS